MIPRRECQPRTIVFLTSCGSSFGGSERLWSGTAERLHARGFRVRVIGCGGPKGLHDEHLRLAGTGIRTMGFGPTPRRRAISGMLHWVHRWQPAFRVLSACTSLARALRACDARLAVISQGDTYDGIRGNVNLAELCDLCGIPYVLVCQQAADYRWPEDADRAEIKRGFTNAQKVFFVSEHNRRCAREQLALPLLNAQVIRNPFMVDAEHALPWPLPLEKTQETLRVACVGRLCARDKGQDVLLNVLSRDSWRNRKLEINFFGQGVNARGLEEMARMLGLRNVHFRGFTDDVTRIWREHHALILPSRHEGLPLALVEAMMCGRLGIVADAGGITEVVRDEVTGFVAPALTVDALADAMERAWSRRHEWEQIGRKAAHEIRRLVPHDPCAVFADILASIHTEITLPRSPGHMGHRHPVYPEQGPLRMNR
jgi:glycosyltransferase involved in cell wall biosynthesis